MNEKPKEPIHEEFQRFEQSISNIDNKFSMLNSNLVKLQMLAESARNALVSRENTGHRKYRSGNGPENSSGLASSGFPTNRINNEESYDSMMLNIEEISNAEGGFRGVNNTQEDHLSARLLREIDVGDESDYKSEFEEEKEVMSPLSSGFNPGDP